jgi:hypothetical protein
VRFKASVALHVTAVVPIGKFSPELGEHVTLTGLCPPVADGVSKVTVNPPAFTVARETPSPHDSNGAGGGGGGGGGGVGAVGLQAALMASIPANAAPITQDFTLCMYLNQPFYRTVLSSLLIQVMTP